MSFLFQVVGVPLAFRLARNLERVARGAKMRDRKTFRFISGDRWALLDTTWRPPGAKFLTRTCVRQSDTCFCQYVGSRGALGRPSSSVSISLVVAALNMCSFGRAQSQRGLYMESIAPTAAFLHHLMLAHAHSHVSSPLGSSKAIEPVGWFRDPCMRFIFHGRR